MLYPDILIFHIALGEIAAVELDKSVKMNPRARIPMRFSRVERAQS